jgi:hypothetical protein
MISAVNTRGCFLQGTQAIVLRGEAGEQLQLALREQ